MSMSAATIFPIGTAVIVGGVTGTVFGTGTVYRDGRPIPQWIIRTPAGIVRVAGNEVYNVEAA